MQKKPGLDVADRVHHDAHQAALRLKQLLLHTAFAAQRRGAAAERNGAVNVARRAAESRFRSAEVRETHTNAHARRREHCPWKRLGTAFRFRRRGAQHVDSAVGRESDFGVGNGEAPPRVVNCGPIETK